MFSKNGMNERKSAGDFHYRPRRFNPQVGEWQQHGIKGFVTPTKSFVKIGITKIFCYSNKMFSSINKMFGCCSKIFVCTNKKIICCPLFCCRNKTIFFREGQY